MTADTGELARLLAHRAAKSNARVAYSIVPLDGSPAIRVDGDAAMPTASTFKVYLLAALYAADTAGQLSLDSRVDYNEATDYVRGSGVLKLLASGARLSLRDYARLMIVISDNVATNIVMRALGGPQAANDAVHALPIRLSATEIRDYINFEGLDVAAGTWSSPFAVSSPNDFTELLAAIYRRSCTGSPLHDEEMYWIMRRQQLRSMIARHLPCLEYAEEFGVKEDVRCGSKSGGMPGIRADVGIVETPGRSWVMAVMVQGEHDFAFGVDHPLNLLVADMSGLVFEAWT
jgi:beta-lactamase class A